MTNIVIEDDCKKTDTESKKLINAQWLNIKAIAKEERVKQWIEKDAKNSSSIAFENIKKKGGTKVVDEKQ